VRLESSAVGQSRVFFPRAALDEWLSENRVEIGGRELLLKSEGRRYRIVEAVRILGEVSGLTDPYDIVGRVKSVAFVTELGAELLESSMVLGDNAFDVVPGFLATPVGTFSEYRADRSGKTPGRSSAPTAAPRSEEELLLRFVARRPV
jgi:hypothetical protein